VALRAEYHFAAAHRTVPQFKYNSTITPSESFPEELQLETAKTSPYNLVAIPTYGHIIYQIFRQIHLLGIATSLRWKATCSDDTVMRVNISNMILDVEYDMLDISARFSQDRNDKDSDSDIDKNLIAVCDALVTAAQIFLFASLRSIPIGARTVEIFLSRIKVAIQREDLLGIWDRFASHDALLWTLFISAVAAKDRPGQDGILSQLRAVVAVLGIKTQETLEYHLLGIAWADFFERYSAELAKELFRSQSQPLGTG
jgi:hypothetical protein